MDQYFPSPIGGVLIGLSASFLLLTRVAGVSGIVGALLAGTGVSRVSLKSVGTLGLHGHGGTNGSDRAPNWSGNMMQLLRRRRPMLAGSLVAPAELEPEERAQP